MDIAIYQPYGSVYANDRLFDPKCCTIGQNLLLPGIKLKEKLESMGHSCHTIDYYKEENYNVLLSYEIQGDSLLTISSYTDLLKYIFRFKYKTDYLYRAHKRNIKKLLVIQEPPSVKLLSYNTNFHNLYHKILTWKDDLIDNHKYYKYFYPQVKPFNDSKYFKDFNKKKFLTMICGNKTSDYSGELYSKRRELIDYFENNNIEFDLFGFGWDNQCLKNYKGTIVDKLEMLSNYKFSICFENMTGVNGYITEKIFDCFFAKCIPIYLGADNIADYIPENTFIDYRYYSSLEQMIEYINSMDEKQYDNILSNIDTFINSSHYYDNFSLDSYVNRMVDFIIN